MLQNSSFLILKKKFWTKIGLFSPECCRVILMIYLPNCLVISVRLASHYVVKFMECTSCTFCVSYSSPPTSWPDSINIIIIMRATDALLKLETLGWSSRSYTPHVFLLRTSFFQITKNGGSLVLILTPKLLGLDMSWSLASSKKV